MNHSQEDIERCAFVKAAYATKRSTIANMAM
jgi:hypothetical protein